MQTVRSLLLELQERVPRKFLVAENKTETICLGAAMDREDAEDAAVGALTVSLEVVRALSWCTPLFEADAKYFSRESKVSPVVSLMFSGLFFLIKLLTSAELQHRVRTAPRRWVTTEDGVEQEQVDEDQDAEREDADDDGENKEQTAAEETVVAKPASAGAQETDSLRKPAAAAQAKDASVAAKTLPADAVSASPAANREDTPGTMASGDKAASATTSSPGASQPPAAAAAELQAAAIAGEASSAAVTGSTAGSTALEAGEEEANTVPAVAAGSLTLNIKSRALLAKSLTDRLVWWREIVGTSYNIADVRRGL